MSPCPQNRNVTLFINLKHLENQEVQSNGEHIYEQKRARTIANSGTCYPRRIDPKKGKRSNEDKPSPGEESMQEIQN
jgi:hypothetical protein